MSDYRKFAVHLAVSLLGLVLAAADGGITATEATQLAVVAAGTAAVYSGTNAPAGPWAYTKAICAWIVAVGTAVIPYVSDGWAGVLDGFPVIAAATAAALGVGVFPNTATTSLADAVRATLAEVQQLRAGITTGPAATAQGRSAYAPEVSATQPASTAGARHTTSAVDTATLEAVQARSGGSYLEQ